MSVIAFPGVDLANVHGDSRQRVPGPAEIGLQWLIDNRPHAVQVIGNVIFDLIDDKRAARCDPWLASRLRRAQNQSVADREAGR